MMDMTLDTWIDIGALEDLPIQGARIVKTPKGCIAVFRTADDSVYALEDSCPHKAGPLSQGIVHDKSVTCPLHNWVIDLESGGVQGPDTGQVKTIPTHIKDGRILMDFNLMESQAA